MPAHVEVVRAQDVAYRLHSAVFGKAGLLVVVARYGSDGLPLFINEVIEERPGLQRACVVFVFRDASLVDAELEFTALARFAEAFRADLGTGHLRGSRELCATNSKQPCRSKYRNVGQEQHLQIAANCGGAAL